MSLKNMSLKRSIFVLSVCCVAVSLVLVGVVFYICKDIQRRYIGTVMEMEEGPVGYGLVEREGPIRYEFTLKQQRIPWVLDVIWMLACIVLPVTGLGIAGESDVAGVMCGQPGSTVICHDRVAGRCVEVYTGSPCFGAEREAGSREQKQAYVI